MAKQKETNVWKLAQLILSPFGFRLFRNQRYKGPIVRKGKITDAWADCGLCDGAGDLIGYRIITITAAMVGKKIAQFCALESKTDTGPVRDDQEQFMNTVKDDGGFADVIRPGFTVESLLRSQERGPNP